MNTTQKKTLVIIAGLFLSFLGLPIIGLLANYYPEQINTIWGLALTWATTLILLFLIKQGEKRPFSSIGYSAITGKESLLAIAIGIVLSLCVPLLTLLAGQILPSASEGGIMDTAAQTSWFMILFAVITAGVTEEIIFRGYLIERLNELTGKPFIAVTISVIAFTLPHILNWNVTHVIGVVLPLGLILSWIYLWKQNLLFNIIIHTMIDLPLVFIAISSN